MLHIFSEYWNKCDLAVPLKNSVAHFGNQKDLYLLCTHCTHISTLKWF